MEKLFHAMDKYKDLLDEVAQQHGKSLSSNEDSKRFLIYK